MTEANKQLIATDLTLTMLTASELAERIRAGELSSQEVVEAHIQRIKAVNPHLNALVVPLFEQARREASEADAAYARGEAPGALHGVPITIKEQYLVAGTPTTFGLSSQVGHLAQEDGPLITRLRKAGAILLGKTNVSQLLAYSEAENPVYGRTNNPWNLNRTSGGSSGGEAAIIAAGGSPLGLGGDLGGSIRTPAHFCGIHGFKPTSGRLTTGDTPSALYASGQEAILAQPGPLARSVADLSLMMSVLTASGEGAIDPGVPPVPWREPITVSLSTLRIGVYIDDGYFTVAPALRRVVQEAAGALRAQGAHVDFWAPPDTSLAVRLFLGALTADGAASFKHTLGKETPDPRIRAMIQAAGLPRPLRSTLANLAQWRGQSHLTNILRGVGRRSTSEYWTLIEECNRYRARFLTSLNAERLDALICPPFALSALTHGASKDLVDAGSYAMLYNVLGMPAGTVAASRVRSGEESDRIPGTDRVDQAAQRVELGSTGLPVGVQVVGRHWREDVVLAVMAALEQHFRTQPDYPVHPPINVTS